MGSRLSRLWDAGFFGLAYYGYPDKGLVAELSIGLLMVLTRASWGLRARPWFWPVITVLIVVHLATVMIARFPHPKLIIAFIAPIAVLDFSAMMLLM